MTDVALTVRPSSVRKTLTMSQEGAHLWEPPAGTTAITRTRWRFLLPSELVLWSAQKRRENGDRAVELYVVIVTLLLAVLWWEVGRDLQGQMLAGLAGYRLAEIFAVGTGLIAGSKAASVAHRLHTIGLYGLQMVLIFAIFGEVFVSDSGNWAGSMPHDQVGWLYLSLTNLLVRGNQYVPNSHLAEGLIVLTLGSGVFLLSVFVAFAVSRLPGRS